MITDLNETDYFFSSVHFARGTLNRGGLHNDNPVNSRQNYRLKMKLTNQVLDHSRITTVQFPNLTVTT